MHNGADAHPQAIIDAAVDVFADLNQQYRAELAKSTADGEVEIFDFSNLTLFAENKQAVANTQEEFIKLFTYCTGEFLGLLGGPELLHRVIDSFGKAHGPQAYSWLNARWDGIQLGSFVWLA